MPKSIHSSRIGVLGNPEGFYVQDLLRAAGGESRLKVVEFESLGAELSASHFQAWDNNHAFLESLDTLIVRTMPWGSLDQIIFRIDLLHQLQAAGVKVINAPATLEVAIDKFRTIALLQQAEIPVPRTVACQTVGQAMQAFERMGNVAVVKPMFGGEGRGIMRLEDPELAARSFKTLIQLGAVIYLQEFIPHAGFDIRILVMGDRSWAIRRSHPTDWRTNLSRGAVAEPLNPEPQWTDLAHRSARLLGAWMAGVDLLIDPQRGAVVLEVNAVPGWKGLAQALNVDIAAEMLAALAGEPLER